mgnify:CR=1 FL=1
MHPYYKDTSHCPLCHKELTITRGKIDYDVSADMKLCTYDQYSLFDDPVDHYWERMLKYNAWVFYSSTTDTTQIILRARERDPDGIFDLPGKHIFASNLEEIINNSIIL